MYLQCLIRVHYNAHLTVQFHYNTPYRKYSLNRKQCFKTRKEMMRKNCYNSGVELSFFFFLSFCTISHFFTQDTQGYFEIIRLLSFYFNYVCGVTRYFILSDVYFLIVASFSCDPWLRKVNALKMYWKTFEKQSPKYWGYIIDLRNNFTPPRSFSGLYIHFIYFI